jgi:hypothetical protein
MKTRTMALIAALLVCAVGVGVSTLPALGASKGSQTEVGKNPPRRSIFTQEKSWRESCNDSAPCAVHAFHPIKLTTPAGFAYVDLTLTATVDLKVTPSDWATFSVDLRGGPAVPLMAPGELNVMSPSSKHPTSTTLVWAEHHLPAEGRTYTFGLGAVAGFGFDDSDGSATVSGRHLTLVAQESRA